MYIPENSIIDNDQLKLFNELNNILKEQKNIDIACGYFNLGGYELINVELDSVKSCRILLGKEPEIGNDKKHDIVNFYNRNLRQSFEEEDFNKSKEDVTHKLIEFLRRNSTQIRIYEKSFLHGKAYIFDKLIITGSSNFTYSGLTSNTELNAVLTDVYAQYVKKEWFEKFWSESRDFKEELIQILLKSKFGYLTTPYQVYLKALYELQKEDIVQDTEEAIYGTESRVNLAEHKMGGVRSTHFTKSRSVLISK